MNNRRKLLIALGASALPASLAALAPITPAVVARNCTLVIFNTNVNARTADGKTSEQCADYYAANRGYGENYHKLGVDFGGRSYKMQYSDLVGDYTTLRCAKSSPESTRYTGQLVSTAVKNIVADFGLEMIFVESLVPNMSYFGNPPEGRYFSTLAKPTRMPYGRIGYPGCTFADIVRMVGDANWAETKDNTLKLHVVGGTDYLAGGDRAHMTRANASFATRINASWLGAFDQDGAYAAGELKGFRVDYNAFNSGTLVPKLNAFGMLWSRNPNTAGYTPALVSNNSSWTPQRGAWAWNWCSGSYYVGYSTLHRGGCCAILNEMEPNSNGIPSTDYVASALMAGKTMAEACSGSAEMVVPNASVYGVPDYAPYPIRLTRAPPA